MTWKARAGKLLAEYDMCCRAQPKINVIDIQLEKDICAKWASHLSTQRGWGTDAAIAEAYHQLAPRLARLKEKLIIEILQNGTI